MGTKHVALGLGFGFVLSRVGATQYDAIASMFRLTDLHLMGVIGTAVVLLGIFFAVARRRGFRDAAGVPMRIEPKPIRPGMWIGAALFGTGWAISGTCPGTALAQIGEGHVMGAVIFAGILGGVLLHDRLHPATETSKTALNAAARDASCGHAHTSRTSSDRVVSKASLLWAQSFQWVTGRDWR